MKMKALHPHKKADIIRAALLLRFRRTDPGPRAYRFLAYAKIAAILNLSVHEVAYHCRKASAGPDPQKRIKDPARKLDQCHVDYLIGERTLERWAGRTLQERAALFTAAFPDKKIAVTTLRRLYLKHGIKRKRVVLAKVVPPRHAANYQEWQRIILRELAAAERNDLPVLFLDETNFTKASLQTREWSGRRSNLSVDQKEVYTGYRSVIATVSRERGVDLIHVQDRAVNEFDFARYLGLLSQTRGREPFALFMDNLRVHKTQLVRSMYARLRITPIFNVPYCPETNPIEACFSQVKRHFCRRRLHCLVTQTLFDREAVIREAFAQVRPEHVARDADKSLKTLSALNF